jgi:hypothetical protein
LRRSAVYRVVPLKNAAFGVEIVIPGTHPATVSTFVTEADAEAWIAEHKSFVETYDSGRRWGRRSPAAASRTG